MIDFHFFYLAWETATLKAWHWSVADGAEDNVVGRRGTEPLDQY